MSKSSDRAHPGRIAAAGPACLALLAVVLLSPLAGCGLWWDHGRRSSGAIFEPAPPKPPQSIREFMGQQRMDP